jgi:myo-inositol-hexaphosphate 3-phosphohydrolase
MPPALTGAAARKTTAAAVVRNSLMRIAVIVLLSLTLISGCGRQSADAPENSAAPIILAEAPASDALSGLSAPPTGIAFWTHPNVAFNGLVIVASEDGVASYNIEDGNEVSRIPGVNAQGAAVSYLGVGSQARGLLAYFDLGASAFKIHTIDNASRAFQPVEGDIPIRGALRGFCFGRAADAQSPELVVLQKGEMTRYTFSVEDNSLTATADITQAAPADVVSCAVDNNDGSVFVARENGAIHRIDSEEAGALFARADIAEVGDVAILLSQNTQADLPSVSGKIVLLDKSTGDLHVFNREGGQAIGVLTVTTSGDDEGSPLAVGPAKAMGATGANLGGLYRNGAMALGVTPDDRSDNSADQGVQSAAIHLVPVNEMMNMLDLPNTEPVNPRGVSAPVEDDGLLIDIEFVED